jgi:hypothetical protein
VATYPGAIPDFAESAPTNLGDADSKGRTHSQKHVVVEQELEAALTELGTNPSGSAATVADRLTDVEEFGVVPVIWNGSAWRCRGATITARNQVTVAAFTDGAYIMWDSSTDADVTTPPSLAIAGDKWLPHGDVNYSG